VVYCGVVQVGQVSHVVAHLVLGRVHLQQLVSFECDGLIENKDFHQCTKIFICCPLRQLQPPAETLAHFVFSGLECDIVTVLFGDHGALVALFFAWHEEVLGDAVGLGGESDLLGLGHQQVLE